jgi:hypothetical protein
MANMRIATVKATGARYLVLNLDFGAGVARLWGEMQSVNTRVLPGGRIAGGSLKFGPVHAVALDAVDVVQVPGWTEELIRGLMAQTRRNGGAVPRPSLVGLLGTADAATVALVGKAVAQ